MVRSADPTQSRGCRFGGFAALAPGESPIKGVVNVGELADRIEPITGDGEGLHPYEYGPPRRTVVGSALPGRDEEA